MTEAEIDEIAAAYVAQCIDVMNETMAKMGGALPYVAGNFRDLVISRGDIQAFARSAYADGFKAGRKSAIENA